MSEYDELYVAAMIKIFSEIIYDASGTKVEDFFDDNAIREKESKIRNGFASKMYRKSGKNIYLNNLMHSYVIDKETLFCLLLMYYLKKNEPMSLNKVLTKTAVKKFLDFISPLRVEKQIGIIDRKSKQIKREAKKSKLGKILAEDKNIFTVDKYQKNVLYDLMNEAKISPLLYAYYLKNDKFKIDESKIKDNRQKKIIKFINELNKRNITVDKIRYEV